MYAFGIAGFERVPGVQVLAGGHQPIGAGLGEPAHGLDLGGRQRDAVGYIALPFRVVGAAAGLPVEQPAGDIAIGDFAGIDVFQLVQAAQAATVAERFPFRPGHFAQ